MAQVAVIAGCMDGCEAAVANALRELGYLVVGIATQPSKCAQPLSDAAVGKAYDCSSPEEASVVIDRIAAEAGEPLVLVSSFAPAASTSALGDLPQVALAGVFALATAAWRRMQVSGFGRIVHVVPTSTLSGCGSAGEAATASAIRGLIKVLAMEGGRSGITANVIVTSCIGTERDEVAPVGRPGEPQDLARGIAFLCDPRNAFATGTTLSINGGLHMY